MGIWTSVRAVELLLISLMYLLLNCDWRNGCLGEVSVVIGWIVECSVVLLNAYTDMILWALGMIAMANTLESVAYL